MSEHELHSVVVDPWVRGEWIELGERKWNPQAAKLTVLEGPEIPLDQLTMGRGWRSAQRRGREVTEQILSAARETQTVVAKDGTPDPEHADTLALQILAELGDNQTPLRRIWEVAQTANRQIPPSRSLALAEAAVRSLLRSGLIVVLVAESIDSVERRILDSQAEQEAVLKDLVSWAASEQSRTVRIKRS
jgi:hypothetical protein